MANGKKRKKSNKRANKYTMLDKGWWYNTDVTESNPKGVPNILEGLSEELHRKRPISDYLNPLFPGLRSFKKKRLKKYDKGGKTNNNFNGRRQYD
tara:strand:+ start:20334 stop:20618 length:285 start_codon:yes stop_codon:yes gene_type:complete